MIFLRSALIALLLGLAACGDDAGPVSSDDSNDPSGEVTDEGDDTTVKDAGRKDAGGSTVRRDASTPPATTNRDASTPPSTTNRDASTPSNTNKDAGGGTGLPDLGGLFGDGGIQFPTVPTTPSTPADGGTTMGPPGDKSGPCKDLQLLCFDPFDMFIFNPSDCFTCNGGMGCQGCAIPFAY